MPARSDLDEIEAIAAAYQDAVPAWVIGDERKSIGDILAVLVARCRALEAALEAIREKAEGRPNGLSGMATLILAQIENDADEALAGSD